MCGIAGIIGFADHAVEEETLRRMIARLAHRGPDARATHLVRVGATTIGLACARLAVIDLSPQGEQPISLWRGGRSGAPHTIVYNGELYNYRSLRSKLEAAGYAFRSQCDTEVLLAAYLHWGERAFERCNGMWACCIVDEQTGAGLLVRDRYGVKPLYWSADGGRLRFASEIGALSADPDQACEIDTAALGLYLRLGWIPHPYSIWRGVEKLAPGHLLRFDARGPQRPVAWYALPESGVAPPAYEDAVIEVRERIGAAVAARLVADVPLGALLSGGIDSSIIVAHMAARASGPVKTYSIGFAEEPRYDESARARAVAQRFGTEHHEVMLTFADVLAALPEMLSHVGEPFGDASLIPTSLVCREARCEVTVALSGDGGDELFAGYWRYIGHHYLHKYRLLPAGVRSWLIEPLLARLPMGKGGALSDRARQMRKMLRAESDDALERHVAWAQILAPEAAEVFAREEERAASSALLRDMYRQAGSMSDGGCGSSDGKGAERPREADPLRRILRADLRIGLPGDMLHKVDLASMRHSLEVRVPLLDVNVVEYSSGLPSSYKLAGTRTKRLLRDAYRDVLPGEVLERGKMGFELPIGEFLRGPLREMFCDVVRRETLESVGPLDHAAVMRLYDDHVRRRGEHADILYAVMGLCWWARRSRG